MHVFQKCECTWARVSTVCACVFVLTESAHCVRQPGKVAYCTRYMRENEMSMMGSVDVTLHVYMGTGVGSN